MKSIEDHIQKDKEILADPNTSEPMRRHTLDELHELEEYVDHHHDEIEAGDHHDPNALELFCDMHPDEPESLVYDDKLWNLDFMIMDSWVADSIGGSVKLWIQNCGEKI